MAVNNNWRPTVTMDDWMRDIEKRLMHEERRPPVAPAEDVVGPGFRPYAVVVRDWDSDDPIVGGHFYSDANQVVNSPDDTKHWIGIVQSNPYGQGVQRLWQYLDDVDDDADPETPPTQDPHSDPTIYTRSFVTLDDGNREYSDWSTSTGGGGGAPSGPAGGDLTGTYPDPQIAAGAVGSTEIADGSVTNNDLAATGTKDTTTFLRGDGTWAVPPGGGGVSDGDKGDITVSGGGSNWQIKADAVGANEIANGSVGNLELGTNAVTSGKIAPGAVDSTAIADGAVGTVDLADNAVTLAKMADNSVGSAELVDGSVGNAELANNAVTSAKIADGTIALADLGPTVTAAMIKRYANTIGAMTAGVEITVTHALGTTDVDATFRIAASDLPIELDWRPFDIDTIRVKADVAFAVNAIRVVVMG